MKVTFLGTGTSFGVPIIGCTCPVCTSDDPRNRRRRASIVIEHEQRVLVVDTPPDFREQVLDHGVARVDAVLITHAHADHIFGFDDLRSFYWMKGEPLPVFAAPGTIDTLRGIFGYVEKEIPKGASVLRVRFIKVTEPFEAEGVSVLPVPVEHGKQLIYGYRFDVDGGSLGYVPDCSGMPDESVAALQGVDVMVLDALKHGPHPTHFSLDESLEVLQRIGAASSYITHMGHTLEHVETQNSLPPSVSVPYDGLTLEW